MNQVYYGFANLRWWFYFQFKTDLELSSETLRKLCQDLTILVAVVVLLLFRSVVDARHLWVSVGCREPLDNSSAFW